MNHQKTTSKKEDKRASKSANLMFQMDRNKIQNRNKNWNLEILKKPRSKEYIRLAKLIKSLGKELSEVEAQIEKETEKLTLSEKPQKVILETKGRLLHLKERHQSLLEEFKYTMEQFTKEIPVPDKILGIIYPDYNEKLLMRYGIISCPGEAFCTEEELIQNVNPDSKRVEEQWRKGYREYCINRDNDLLLTEVYIDTVCVVFKNGETKVAE